MVFLARQLSVELAAEAAFNDVEAVLGQRARDIEKAREIFTAEIRAFVNGVLAGVRRIRSEPWAMSPRSDRYTS